MFNLGPCYITVGVFNNMSVLQKDTVFPRLTMFHVDGDEDMYGKLFTSLRDTFASEVAFAESAGVDTGHRVWFRRGMSYGERCKLWPVPVMPTMTGISFYLCVLYRGNIKLMR